MWATVRFGGSCFTFGPWRQWAGPWRWVKAVIYNGNYDTDGEWCGPRSYRCPNNNRSACLGIFKGKHQTAAAGEEVPEELPTLEEREFGPVEDMIFGAKPVKGDVVAKVATDGGTTDCGKYHIETFEEEADAEEQERTLNVLATQKAGAETVSAKVFTSGTKEAQHPWFLAAQKK